MIALRDYQGQCVGSIREQLSNGSRSTLAVLPTGTGKTICFSTFVNDWLSTRPEKRALIIAHREELIFQARDKYKSVSGEDAEIEMGEFRAVRQGLLSSSSVVVSSVQTQNAGPRCKVCNGTKVDEFDPTLSCRNCIDGVVRRMQRFDPFEFDLLVIDEAHHATAGSYRRLIDHYSKNPDLRILGVTATPDRADEEALGKIFDSVAFEYGVVDAINDGWLVPIKQEWVTCENLDFANIKTTAGDLNAGELEAIMVEEKALHQVTSPTLEIAGDRATLVFAAGVQHAQLMADIFNRHKPDSAVCIHGNTPPDDRRRLLREYSQGRFQFLCNCGVFLEGFDEPRVEVVAMARPTKSRALYAQCVGRGTRPIDPPSQQTAQERREAIAASIKPECLVLDFVGNSGRHKLVSTADILGGKFEDDILERAVKNAKKKTGKVDMQEELEFALQERDDERRRKREQVVAKAQYSKQIVDPFDVFDLVPQRTPGWHKGRKPSDKMLAMLDRNGIKTKDVDFVHAKQLIGEIIHRRESGLCSYKQAKILERFGYSSKHMTFETASKTIDAIAQAGWKRPAEPQPVST